jgi:hypothetical protein
MRWKSPEAGGEDLDTGHFGFGSHIPIAPRRRIRWDASSF